MIFLKLAFYNRVKQSVKFDRGIQCRVLTVRLNHCYFLDTKRLIKINSIVVKNTNTFSNSFRLWYLFSKLRHFKYDQIESHEQTPVNLYVADFKQPIPNNCTILMLHIIPYRKLHTISFQLAYNLAVCTVGKLNSTKIGFGPSTVTTMLYFYRKDKCHSESSDTKAKHPNSIVIDEFHRRRISQTCR